VRCPVSGKPQPSIPMIVGVDDACVALCCTLSLL
jgi:hypothetical protein